MSRVHRFIEGFAVLTLQIDFVGFLHHRYRLRQKLYVSHSPQLRLADDPPALPFIVGQFLVSEHVRSMPDYKAG